MKIKVIGIERAAGTSMKTGTAKPYDIGNVHAIVELEESGSSTDTRRSKGAMGTTYSVSSEIVKQIEELPLPFDAEMTIQDVMRMGKRESKVMDIRPIDSAPIRQVKAA